MATVTVANLVDQFGQDLSFTWHQLAHFDNVIHAEGSGQTSTNIVGHMNCIHPVAVQVLGREEIAYLEGLRPESYEEILRQLASGKSRALIIADGIAIPEQLLSTARDGRMDVLCTDKSANEVINKLRFQLQDVIADSVVVHGVFMEVIGIGVLLCGNSGIGKSELALELLSRGHRLIADDAPLFSCSGPNLISGSCPPAIQDFMEVRGLGILNVRAMFGDSAIKKKKDLKLIVELVELEGRQLSELERIDNANNTREILGIKIPLVTIPVAPGRNIAVIVETAARNQILLNKGYNAASAFMRQQKTVMENSRK